MRRNQEPGIWQGQGATQIGHCEAGVHKMPRGASAGLSAGDCRCLPYQTAQGSQVQPGIGQCHKGSPLWLVINGQVSEAPGFHV